jgi:signal transduction histidine kinase
MDKIFQPPSDQVIRAGFFTTKPTGQTRPTGSSGRRTELGLSLSYDIVKAHGGELKEETKEGEGSEFIKLLNDQENSIFCLHDQSVFTFYILKLKTKLL